MAEMMICHEYKIPYSQLINEWQPEDRDLAMAYMRSRAETCPRCGTHPSEWLDDDGEPLEPPPYVATSVRCLGCATLEEARTEAGEAAKSPTLTFNLKKISRKAYEGVHRQWQMRRST